MKTLRTASLLLPLAALLISAPAVFADGDESTPADAPFKPKEYPLSKYSQFEKKSPFEFDPPPADQPIAEDNFKDVSLGGYCGSGNTLTVYLIVGKEKKRVTVYGDGSPFKQRDDSGFRIVSLKKGGSLGSTSVLLEKGGQQKEVKFEKETLTAKGAGGGGGQVQMVPDGKGGMVPRQVIPRPAGAPAGGPPQVYQAPAPFIPGQSNVPGGQGGGQMGNQGMNLQAQQQAAAAAANQQLMNQLVNTPNVPQQPVITPVPGQNNTTGQPQPTQPRRRVVLPTQNP